MIEIHIEIGEAKTLDCEDWKITPDNRITKISTIGGNVVQNYGHVQSGDKISCKCNVSAKDAEKIFGYWNNQEKVTIIDEAGEVYENMRVLVGDYGYVSMFEKEKYYWMNLEFWRI